MTRTQTPRTTVVAALIAALVAALAMLTQVAAPPYARAAEDVTLVDLKVEKKTEPLGIDVERPRFSWVINTTARAVGQTSYRLRVGSTEQSLADGDLIWDSGVVASAESANVEYDGPALAAATRHHWRVDVVTTAGSASSISWFGTGLMGEADWQASEWIGNPRPQGDGEFESDMSGAHWIHPPYPGGNTPSGYFRTTFTLAPDKAVARAELLITGDRGYSVFLNGHQVANDASGEDGWRQAERVIVHPAAGENQLAIRLNNTAKAFGGVVGKLTVHYADGTTLEVPTDESWQVSQSATTGWHLAGYDDSTWTQAAARAEFGSGPWGGQVAVPVDATGDVGVNFDTSSWVIAPIGEPSTSNPVPSTLFRQSFTVDNPDDVVWAQLAVTGDQVYTAYVNGDRVAGNTDANNAWQTATTVSIVPVAGRNTLAVELQTPGDSQYGGILTRLRIGYADGTSVDHISDASMLAYVIGESGTPTNWTAPDFDDSAWPNARAEALYRGWVYGDRVNVSQTPVGGEALTLVGSDWIWTPEQTSPVAPGEDRAFRFAIDSPEGVNAISADVLITADDSYRLWVNGEFIAATEGAVNQWQQSNLHPVGLEPGRNVFALRTTNGAGSAAGLVAAILVRYSDGSTDTVRTGEHWLAAKEIPGGFEQPDFDDSAWEHAVVQAAFGSGPWGGAVRPPQPAPNPVPLLRHEFDVDPDLSAATLFLAAGGVANVRLNGEPASDELLAPGFTDYDDTVQYIARDVTDALHEGRNAIGMELGRGFYGMTGANVWWWERAPWHDEPVARAVLQLEYADGSVEHVVTDDTWRIHDGPTRFDDLYAGETYDASLVATGYDTAGYDDQAWTRASAVRGPHGELVNQRQQPIRVTETLPAESITEPVPGTWVVKFPRVIAGNVEVTATGAQGETIRMQYGEKLLPNGLPSFANNGGFASGFQTDRFVLAGTGEPETWQAAFSYKGFQYIQVTGWPEGHTPTAEAFTASVVHSDTEVTGTFDSSSEIMNGTHRAVVDTLLNNLHGIPTDTPMFEKNGWTGDAALGAEMFLMNLDAHELFAKWMRDVHETRDAEGAPLVIAPSSGSWGEWGVAPTWHSAYILIPWWLYQYGGDSRVLTEYYDGMKDYVDLEYGRSPGGIANTRLGDWVSPEASPAGGNAPEDTRVSATAYLYAMLVSMQQTAEFLGHDVDAAVFEERAAIVKDAFNDRFLAPDGSHYRGIAGDNGYRQTHNVLALAFDLAPDEEIVQRVADSIAADVRSRGTTLNTGILGTKYLLPVLTAHGHADVAYELAVQTAYPSWGYKLANGATTMWEHWALESRSLGHYFLGTVDDWFYHDVAGIRSGPRTGYRDITIRPAVTEQLDWARATTQSPFGPVTSDWRNTPEGLRLDVSIPVGSTATVHLPAATDWAVTEGGVAVAEADGVSGVTAAEGEVLVTIGSGTYSFLVDERVTAIGLVIDALDALADEVPETAADAVASARGEAVAALALHREGHEVPAAEALAPVLGHLDAIDEAAAGLTATAREATYDALNGLLGVRVTLTLDAPAHKPGDPATATVVVANSGRGVLLELAAGLDGPDGWEVSPDEQPLVDRIEPDASQEARFTVTVPLQEVPGRYAATAVITHLVAGQPVVARAVAEFVVDSPVTVAAAFEPASVRPDVASVLQVSLGNDGTAPSAGRVEVVAPEGWTQPLASPPVTIPAGGDATVRVPVFIPRDTPETVHEAAFTVRFVRSGATLAEAGVSLEVVIDPDLVDEALDHVDLGDASSEQEHGLTAHESSGTSMEAGLTRRYAGHLTPFSWFEFDLAITQDEPFVLRVVETYDKPQTKRYKVYVDGQEVHLRQFSHTGGEGTQTYEFVVDASHATGEQVRVRFENQDDPAYYDPSIADVWALPVGPDEVAPQVTAELDPADTTPSGWYRQGPVTVTVTALDDRAGEPVIEVATGTGEWEVHGGPVVVDGEGEHEVSFRATDSAGNISEPELVTVRIDGTAPVVAHELGGDRLLTLTASDDVSGVERIEYRFGSDSGWQVYDAPATVPGEVELVRYRAVDVAGNVSGIVEFELEAVLPSPTPTPTPTVTPTPSATPTPTPSAGPQPGGDLYETPGFHTSGGRHWMTACEAYSSVVHRCWTYIWGTTIHESGGLFAQVNGWQFNNLTYVGGSRADWVSNPLGFTNRWTAGDGRLWRTECDTANTGRNGCRSYVVASVIERQGDTFRYVTKEVFNNQVRFR